MPQSRRERRAAIRANKTTGKLMQQFITLKGQQSSLEKKFADTFQEYGLEPYGKDSEQLQLALKTHNVK
jgi:hypothetical protein